MEKILSIIRAYIFMLLYKAGFINDVNYKRVLKQRIASCEDCILRNGNWCSKKNSIVVIKKGSNYETVTGCSCYLPAKIFDDTPDTCPLHRWEELNND